MAWAIFTKPFGYDFRPAKASFQTFNASTEPQQVTRAVLDAAIKAGAAKEAKPRKRNGDTPETGA
jgi:hypothetical protein